MCASYIELLPERCLELILDYLNLEDFNAMVKCCERLEKIGNEVRRMREIRLHQVLRQNGCARWSLLHPKDVKKKEISPGQRFGSTLVHYDSSIYLFGGATVNWTTFNDLWRFDLIEQRWSRRIPRGTCPPPRASASGIVYKDKLIIIGGFELLYSIHAKGTSNWDNLPWIYDFTLNEWRMIMVDTSLLPVLDDDCSSRKFTLSPTPVGQSSCLMLGDQVVLFGGAKTLLNQSQGYHRHSPIHPLGISNDSFCLSVSTSVISEIKIFGDAKPSKRCGHSAMAIDNNKMLILGGNLGPNTKGTEDMWMLSCVDPLTHACTCNSSEMFGIAPIWYWTKIHINTSLQPLLPFLSNATVFVGDSRVTSTLVVLGGGNDEVETLVSSPLNQSNRTSRLIVHAVDLSVLLAHNRCQLCLGERTDQSTVSLCDDHIHGGTEPIRWTSPVATSQDLSHAPCIKHGFGVVCGRESVFIYGGLCYKSVYTRPVYLLNDLMLRDTDADTGDDNVTSNADLHQLTFVSPAITL